MLRYYYINKEWMISATAQRVYRVAAYLSLALFLLLIFLLSAHPPESMSAADSMPSAMPTPRSWTRSMCP
jgi:hypothetical protein